MTRNYVLALDQGTTSSKGVILDRQAQIVAVSENFPVSMISPRTGWIEYDPYQILDSLIRAGRNAIQKAGIESSEIAMVGLANQGETIIGFNKETGEPIGHAISW